MAPSAELRRWFQIYGAYHRHPGNKVTHYLGIPAILVSALGLLAAIPVPDWFPGNPALLALALVSLWYWKLDWKIGVPFTGVLYVLYLVGTTLSPAVNGLLFVGGWVLQFLGHYHFEKRSPAFYDNLLQTLIGPLWIFSRLIGYDRE